MRRLIQVLISVTLAVSALIIADKMYGYKASMLEAGIFGFVVSMAVTEIMDIVSPRKELK